MSARRSARNLATRAVSAVNSRKTATAVVANPPGRPSKRTKTTHAPSPPAPVSSPPAPSSPPLPSASARRPRASKKAVSDNLEDYVKRVESPWKTGAHVSAAGGVENAILNAAKLGANAFALFLKSQRKWESPPLKQENIDLFKSRMKSFGYSPSHILPHGSYLINLGNPDEEKRQKSYDCFLDDLRRCEQLGLTLYNLHPGSTVGEATREETFARIAECINRAHKETKGVTVVLENMAGAGNIIGGFFSDLAAIIKDVDDKTRVGVCLDTCHMFAANYDIRTAETYEKVISEFDGTVGMSYLRGMHLNDSKAALGAKKDRHDNMGVGQIGLNTFHSILRDSRMQAIPLVLETPAEDLEIVWSAEISALNRLSSLETLKESDREEILAGIRDAVERGGKKKKEKKVAKKGRKRKANEQDEEVDSGEEDY